MTVPITDEDIAAAMALHPPGEFDPLILAQIIAKLRIATDFLEYALDAIDKGNIYDRMCCDGQMCGCRGSSNADEVLHFGRQALAQTIASQIGEK